MLETNDELELDAAALADAISDLTSDERETLQYVCSLLLNCFGDKAPRKAVIVLLEESTLSLYNLNADLQGTMELISAAHEAFNEKIIGEIPPKEKMN